MERSLLIFENSPWLILICLVVGAVLTYLLYRKPGPWGSITHYVLITFRFLLISFLCFLLVGPIVKQFNNRIEKPHYVLALDNSASLSEVLPKEFLSDQINRIKTLGQTLETNGYKVEYRSLAQTFEPNTIDSVRFDHPSTPLNDLLKRIQTDYEGKIISGVVLFSDGIHNQGLSPIFTPFKFPIYSMGLGDTIPQQDVRLKAIHYNKIAYQGNRFIIRAEILNDGFIDKNIVINISDGGRILQSKTLELSNPPQLLETDFKLEAANKGLKDFTVSIAAVDGEFSLKNNIRHAYLEIIEGKRKILLASKSPHPDIKAIKNAIEKNKNYQLDLYIPGISNPESDSYDLIILHQISQQEIQRIPTVSNHLNAGLPLWTIVGSKSNLNRVNSENQFISIKTINFQKDLVTPSFNASFSKFQLSPELQDVITNFNPVTVPFANYAIGGGAEVLLFQKVGNLVTNNPLMVVIDDGDQKSAVMVGEGMWQWRMQDYSKNQSFELFDELMSKLVQYLSSNEEKSRFKVYPLTQEFTVNEPAVLETEVYNEIYEETYGHAVDLELSGPESFSETYSYVTSLGNSKYRISNLVPGIYTFKAQTSIDQKPVRSQGQFTVTEMQLEALSLTADHQLLRSLSSKTSGAFYQQDQWENLTKDLSEKQAQGIIFSEEILTPVIKWPWALAILLVLVSMEWILRKYHGSY
jgi:hypothetical protein